MVKFSELIFNIKLNLKVEKTFLLYKTPLFSFLGAGVVVKWTKRLPVTPAFYMWVQVSAVLLMI